MAYNAEGIDSRAEVLVGETDSLKFYLKRDGAAVTPDPNTAFVTVYQPGGGEAVARVAAVIGSGGLLSCTRTWGEATFELSEDYVALWEWQESGVTFKDRQFFDVVRTKLPCLIDTNDLQEFYPDLEKHLASVGETNPTKFIKRAWSELLDRIRSGGNRPSLILDRSRLVNPAIHLALENCCEAMVRQTGDLWDNRAQKHHKRYDALFAGLGELKYDRDEDALAAEGETKRVNRRPWTV